MENTYKINGATRVGVENQWAITVPDNYVFSTDKKVIKDHRGIIIMLDNEKAKFDDHWNATENFSVMSWSFGFQLPSMNEVMGTKQFYNGLTEVDSNGRDKDNLVTHIMTDDLIVAYAYNSVHSKTNLTIFNVLIATTGIVSVMRAFFNNRKKVETNEKTLLAFLNTVTPIYRIKEPVAWIEPAPKKTADKNETAKAKESTAKKAASTSGTTKKASKTDSPKSADNSEASDEFIIEGTVLKKYLGKSKTVKIPEGITRIAYLSFFDTNFVEEIEFPSSIQRFEHNPFKKTKWYKNIKDTLVTAHNNITVNFPVTDSKIEFPENTKAILLVTDSNKILTDVSIPSGVKVLGPVFSDFKKLQNVTLAEGIEEMYGTFAGCRQIKNITLPGTVKKLDRTFGHCHNLKSIEMPDSLTEIADSAFCVCEKMTDIKLNNGLKAIGDRVFLHCTALKSIELPNSLEKLGTSAFCECTALTSIKIPDSVTEFGGGAFKCCTSLTSVELPKHLKKLGIGCFEGCKALTSIEIPEGITEIGYLMFKDCVKLTSIKIPDSVTVIGQKAFAGCKALESIVLPNGLKKIEAEAFKDCVKLKHIVVPESVETIGKDAFSGCIALEASTTKTEDHNTKNTAAEDTVKALLETESKPTTPPSYGSSNSASSPSPNNSSSNSGGGCYVATCVYGSYDCPQVWTLRRFRDYTLTKTWYGRLFIKTYYAVSPHIVKAFGKTKWFNRMWKPVLDKMVNKFHRNGIADTHYDDMIW